MKATLLAITCYLAAVLCNLAGSRMYPAGIREDLKMVSAPEVMQFLCLDQRGFVADYLFSRVNIHSGSMMWKPLDIAFDSEWSFKTMDLITDLDPKYLTAYIFTGMGLIHSVEDVKRARPIMEKGMKNLPDQWEIPFWLGYDFYLYLQDYEAATEYFLTASKIPGVSSRFVTFLLASAKKAGAYESAFLAMQHLYNEAGDEKLKTGYARKMIQLKNLIELSRAAKAYKTARGQYPAELADLTRERFIAEIPLDPFQLSYSWNQEKSMVVVLPSRVDSL